MRSSLRGSEGIPPILGFCTGPTSCLTGRQAMADRPDFMNVRLSESPSRSDGCFRLVLGVLVSLFVFSPSSRAWADDVGISKARLIQKDDTTYVLEVDISQQLVWAIRAPIFPARFKVSEIEYINHSGWIIAQSVMTTSGKSLSTADEILLPWVRNGVDLTVQWLDGSVHQGLFLRSLEGILIPVNLVMTAHQSLREVCIEHFRNGVDHFSFKSVHWLLVLIVVLAFPSYRSSKILLFLAVGQGFSLILADVSVPGFDLLLTDIFLVLAILLLSLSAIRGERVGSFVYLFFILGFLHGLSYYQEISVLELEPDQRLPALFSFSLALDLSSFALAGILALVRVWIPFPRISKVGPYLTGSIAVALILILFQDYVISGKGDILNIRETLSVGRIGLPASLNVRPGRQRPVGARQMTTPIMTYLTVEPNEVRLEILIQARAAVQLLGVQDQGMFSVPIGSLEAIKNGILEVSLKTYSISIDGQPMIPVLSQADFVTMGPAGVVVRQVPQVESLDAGIIGLTLVYSTKDLASAIDIDWNLFTPSIPRVEATTIDPFGGSTSILSSKENAWHWEARLAGYVVPVLEEIIVEKPKLPLVSLFLFLAATGLLIWTTIKSRYLAKVPVIFSLTGLALVMYPFARISADLPLLTHWKPSSERTSDILDGLLTNVYRSFDVREEDQVYDRLALSVMGEQLSQIYLQNRKALELENRGGARARVDEVEVLEVSQIRREAGGFVANAFWTVSGSVSHFGHTHYRQNQYQADVTFMPVDGTWKIKEIEVLDEKRVL